MPNEMSFWEVINHFIKLSIAMGKGVLTFLEEFHSPFQFNSAFIDML